LDLALEGGDRRLVVRLLGGAELLEERLQRLAVGLDGRLVRGDVGHDGRSERDAAREDEDGDKEELLHGSLPVSLRRARLSRSSSPRSAATWEYLPRGPPVTGLVRFAHKSWSRGHFLVGKGGDRELVA